MTAHPEPQDKLVRLFDMLAAGYYRVMAVDISERMLDRAHANGDAYSDPVVACR